jgi:hypothetical protein
MRLFLDTVVALMLLALLAGAMYYNKSDQTDKRDKEVVRADVKRFQQQIALQSTLAKVVRNERGYPELIDPDWFQGLLPSNPLLDMGHPWLEIAGPEQKNLIHPMDRVAVTKASAKFWYNPQQGVVRARVPAEISDAAAVDLYNFINDCNLPDLFASGTVNR